MQKNFAKCKGKKVCFSFGSVRHPAVSFNNTLLRVGGMAQAVWVSAYQVWSPEFKHQYQ
jgi:hypothetical protein